MYSLSGELEQYKGYKVSDVTADKVSFTNGVNLYISDIHGNINEEHKRRIQIRETIRSHLNKERILYKSGIKIMSLFFIDEVKNYRQYAEEGNQIPGKYAQIFEEEYQKIIWLFLQQLLPNTNSAILGGT